MKQHSKEYLLEFSAGKDDWLKALIYNVVETNGDVTDEHIEKIYKLYKDEILFDFTTPSVSFGEIENEVCLKKLTHKSGVNALSPDQTIKFSPNITILYGLNGTGKSSYFRILNELVGGNQQKKVLPNIYLDEPEPIDVEVEYIVEGNATRSYDWDGTERSIEGLKNCSVFDSSYLNGLLETRQTDNTLIQPLGLNLFSYLSNILDSFRLRLQNEADSLRVSKPSIDIDLFPENYRTIFQNHKLDNNLKTEIEEKFVLTEKEKSKIAKLQEEVISLQQKNFQDKITIEEQKINVLADIKESLTNKAEFICNQLTLLNTEIEKYNLSLTANLKAKTKFEILNELPSTESSEWKEFIKKGEEYSRKIDGEIMGCIYCSQPLETEKSIQLIKAYSEYLADETENVLATSIIGIDDIKKELSTLPPNPIIPDAIEGFLEKEILNEEEDLSLLNSINDIYDSLNNLKDELIECCEKKTIVKETGVSNISEVTTKLSDIIIGTKTFINTLNNERKEKNESILNKKNDLNLLLEKQSISNQSTKIKTWFENHFDEVKLRDKRSSINTNSLTELSKFCHKELLTTTLIDSFEIELKEIGFEKLEVKLKDERGNKGTASTKLYLENTTDIKAILSEGEQKAVALSIFLAETSLQKSKNPIILDDPVTSLDHKIAAIFAERLMSLENQIIIFNHNRLFLNAFETANGYHICKKIGSGCSNSTKHIIIYEVLDEGKSTKGVLTNYKTNNVATHIKEAKRLLRYSPFTENLKVAGLIRKAVECCIDEVVFNNQNPTKFSHKRRSINWDGLKKLNNDEAMIIRLNGIHSRVSGGELHNGTENDENKIEKSEFEEMVLSIEGYMTINETIN